MAASTILDLLGVHWDHPRRLLDGLYLCAKVGLESLQYIFDNIKFLIFCAFGLKTPIPAPEIGVFGRFHSFIREQY